MSDSSEKTSSWTKRVVDCHDLFEAVGDLAAELATSNTKIKEAKHVAKQGANAKVLNGYSQARLIVSVVDALCKAILNFSPVDEWIKKPFFGDWDELRATANQWRALSTSLTELHNSVEEVSSKVVEDTWSGKAASMFVQRNDSIAQVIGQGAQPCIRTAQTLEALADEVDNAFDMVMDAIDLVVEMLEALLATNSVPVVGQIASIPEAAGYTAEIIKIAVEVGEYISALVAACIDFASVANSMMKLTAQSQEVLDQFAS